MLTLLLFSRSSISILRRYRNITLLISLVLILLPNLPSGWGFPLRGLSVNGSRLWVLLDVGFTTFQFQPAELAKLGSSPTSRGISPITRRRYARRAGTSGLSPFPSPAN